MTPDFQPLTLSVEEWDDCTLRGRPSMIAKLKVEVEAQSHRADEWQTIAEQRERALDDRNATLTALRQQLEQAQNTLASESDEYAMDLAVVQDALKREKAATERASHAEAQVAGLQKRLAEIQRYDVGAGDSGDEMMGPERYEDPDPKGDWVRYDDLKAVLEGK